LSAKNKSHLATVPKYHKSSPLNLFNVASKVATNKKKN
jgi:hypothetical protein